MKCLGDYEKMYKMMNDKLKFYADNENSLLESVKSTIFKTYERSEEMIEKSNKNNTDLIRENLDKKSQYEEIKKEFENYKLENDLKIKKLNDKVSIKSG